MQYTVTAFYGPNHETPNQLAFQVVLKNKDLAEMEKRLAESRPDIGHVTISGSYNYAT